MPTLLIKHPHHAAQAFELDRLRVTLGRSARNDVCLPDPFASRVHAEIRRDGDNFIVQDLGSANGTFYDGRQLRTAQALTPHACLRIGETEIEFLADSTEARSVAFAPHDTIISSRHTAPRASGAKSESAEARASFNTTTDRTSGLLETIEDAQRHSDALRRTRDSKAKDDLLALISKVGVTLLASQTLDETLKQIVALVFDAVPAERCLIMLRAPDDASRPQPANNRTGEPQASITKSDTIESSVIKPLEDAYGLPDLRVRAAAVRQPDRTLATPAEEIKVSRAVIEQVIGDGCSVLATDAQHDPRFSETLTLRGIRSVLAVPLRAGGTAFGIIYADSPVETTAFDDDHLKILTTLASVAAIRVENTRLLEHQLEQERLEREVQLAREIQQRFQPLSAPLINGYDIIGISFSCYEIGGDYYDFIRNDKDNRLLIALGDVSGKGTAAALLMSSLHAAIHAQATAQTSLLDTVTNVNAYLAANIPPNRFITLFYSELDTSTGTLSFVNAGHNPALVVRSPTLENTSANQSAEEALALSEDRTLDAYRLQQSFTCETLASSGIPLGISPHAYYAAEQTRLAPGDVLVIYSDGVTETVNPHSEEFGITRLRETVERNFNLSAPAMRDRIESELTRFAGDAASVDDVTLVIVKRLIR